MSPAVIGQLLSACAGAYSAASSAVWWAASLPPTCRESMAHAALTCSGATPRYFTPGFGPLALAWGWLLLGVLLGLLSRRAAEAIVGLTSGRQLPHTPWSWEALLRELSARTQDPSRHEVLQYLLQRGEAALVELSIGAHAGFFAGSPSRRRHHGRRWCGFATARQGHASTDDRAAPASARLTPHPYHGRRVGEAAHPGPPCGTDVEHVLPTARTAAQSNRPADLDAADTVSDSLSAITPFASPREEAPAALMGAMAPHVTEEATPGFTPPATPEADESAAGTPRTARQVTPPSALAALPWQDARPPSSAPGERNSWLYVPLLHAGAGTLSTRALQAWRANPVFGPRFEELVATLRRAPPAVPGQLARSLLAVVCRG
eukprot:s6992_g7.t1